MRRKRNSRRRGIGVGGRPLAGLLVMMRGFLIPNTFNYGDMHLYNGCIAVAYSEVEIQWAKGIVREEMAKAVKTA